MKGVKRKLHFQSEIARQSINQSPATNFDSGQQPWETCFATAFVVKGGSCTQP